MLFGGEMKQTKLKSLNLQSLNSMDHAKFLTLDQICLRNGTK